MARPRRSPLTLAQARRVALAAQGFADPRPQRDPGPARPAAGRSARTGVLQIDSVNVLARAHYLPLFCRVGPYPVDAARAGRVPDRPGCSSSTGGTRRACCPVDAAAAAAVAHGRRTSTTRGAACGGSPTTGPSCSRRCWPTSARDGPLDGRRAERRATTAHLPKRTGPWWDWSDVKRAAGVPLLGRRGHHVADGAASSGVYDLPERVLPAEVLAAADADRAEAQRELLRRSIRSLGVGDRARPARLLPAAGTGRQGSDRRAGGGRRAAAGRRSRAGGRPAYLDPTLALPRLDPRRSAALAVRPGGVGARPHRAALRLPLPHRDLRPGTQAGARLLRAAVPARRRAGRPGRPEGRPRRGACWSRAHGASRTRRPRPPSVSAPSCAEWPTGSAWPML